MRKERPADEEPRDKNEVKMLSIIRPKNCLMSGLGALISFLLVSQFDFSTASLVFLSIFVLAAAGNTINDYFDFEMDAKTKPNRPIPSGLMTRQGALSLSVALFSVSIFLASRISKFTLLIALVSALLLTVYPWKLKRHKFVGNIIVSLLVSMVFFYGASPVGLTLPVLVLSVSSFLSNLAREIVKDLEDYSQPERGSLPKILGKRKSAYAAAALLALVVPIGILPPFGLSYKVLIVFSYIFFALAAKDAIGGEYSLGASRIKTGMAVALLAFTSTLF